MGGIDVRRLAPRRRFWIEFGLAVVFASLAILTVLMHDWAEALFGFNPDEQGGALEVGVTIIALIAALAFVLAARIEWRRTFILGAGSQDSDSHA